MIEVETIAGEIKTTFNGSIEELTQELGFSIKGFANNVLGISEIELLYIFSEAYMNLKNKAQNETDAGDEVRQDD